VEKLQPEDYILFDIWDRLVYRTPISTLFPIRWCALQLTPERGRQKPKENGSKTILKTIV